MFIRLCIITIASSLITTGAIAGAEDAFKSAIDIAKKEVIKESQPDKTQPPSQPSSATSSNTSEVTLGYLKNTIKTFDDAGCTYILSQDDKKKGQQRPIAADDYDGKGIVINANGQDVLVNSTNRNKGFIGKFDGFQVSIPEGKSRSCGIECSKTITTINISKGNYKSSTPIVATCGS